MAGPSPASAKKQTRKERKPNRLLKRGDFLRAAASGKKFITPGFVIQKAPNDKGVRYGLTATKKIGNAVKRNRARRRLRALAETVLLKKAKNGDYVLIAREAALTRDFALMAEEIEKALLKLAA